MKKKQIIKTERRAQVIGVTLNLLMPDGSCRTVTIDPSRTEAIFWSDRAVLEMLAPFYDKIIKTVTREQLDKRFFDLDAIFGENKEIRITSKTIDYLWNNPAESGRLPVFIQKTRDCIPRPEPCAKCW